MELDLPFVSSHFDATVGAAYVRSASGALILVARCGRRVGGQYLYEACPEFVVKHANTMALGSVLRWININDLERWLDRIIYLSFTSSGEEVTSNYWFMKILGEDDSAISAELPKAYHDIFEGHLKDKWVLLKYKRKVWPVCTTDNRFYGGWDTFWNDLGLTADCVIIFGAQRKWVFDVIILGTHRREVSFEWPELNQDLPVLSAPTDGLQEIPVLPETFFAESCLFRFAFMCQYGSFFYQAIVSHFTELLLTTDIDNVVFTMQTEKWVIPVVNHDFSKPFLMRFVRELRLSTLDFIVVSAVDPTLVRVLVFGSDGLEKPLGAGEILDGETWALLLV